MRKHILLVTIPSYGHIIPLLELARRIAPFHRVTFAVSQFELGEIRQRELVSSEDPFTLHGIPDGYFLLESEKSQSGQIFQKIHQFVIPGTVAFLKALPIPSPHDTDHKNEGSAPSLQDPVDVVIGDNILGVALRVLHERGIPFHIFNTASSSMTYVSLLVCEDTPSRPDPPNDNQMKFIEAPDPTVTPKPISDAIKTMFLQMHEMTLLAAGIVENSVYELEVDAVEAIRKHPDMQGRPFRSVGPLIPTTERTSGTNGERAKEIEAWLDKQESLSVIYISFGTVAAPKVADMQEIIGALKAIGKPFIWSLRKEEQARLPAELLSEISDWSLGLVRNWVPQKLVLQHRATSVFVTHCGWNSSLEAIAYGVPVVAWPMFADQMLNGLGLVRKGMAVLIQGTGITSDIVVSGEELKSALMGVGVGGVTNRGEDNPFRKAALAWKETLKVATSPGGSSHAEFLELMKF
ncbi:putative Cyanohydrin beta-glucosyltransferase [Hypsibius exemplaris]|uniref:UDP-glucuronosyltransferase n=1 Tax=Hypsibius exemplaris TaxID=2072580 RepID=A0A1W0WKP7_HYPEX|nr:putative Cyanohydrin beta-glucosyltransferase [Hypsibius exemplaris]